MSAADYWADHGLNELADAGEFVTITRRINGGTNGLADRQARLKTATEALA
jgi:putative chitinase